MKVGKFLFFRHLFGIFFKRILNSFLIKNIKNLVFILVNMVDDVACAFACRQAAAYAGHMAHAQCTHVHIISA